jgi:hypothetical protein
MHLACQKLRDTLKQTKNQNLARIGKLEHLHTESSTSEIVIFTDPGRIERRFVAEFTTALDEEQKINSIQKGTGESYLRPRRRPKLPASVIYLDLPDAS